MSPAGPVGDTGKVTVFTKNDFRGSAAIHLDAWWDQAELVTLGDQPAVQPTAADAGHDRRLNRRRRRNRRPPLNRCRAAGWYTPW